MSNLTIGKAARVAGVNVETIRFYERQGLIEQPLKPLNGFRRYEESTIKRILFIKRAQALGFTLAEIMSLLGLSSQSCTEAMQQAEHKLIEVRKKIHDLQQVEGALLEVIASCKSSPIDANCPILAAFTDGP